MFIQIRTSAIVGIALLALCPAGSSAQSNAASSFGIQPTDYLSEATAPQHDDIQFQSDHSLATSGANMDAARVDELGAPSPTDLVVVDGAENPADSLGFSGSLDSGGVMFNGHHPQSHFNGPVTFADRDEGQLDQLYMVGGFGTGESEKGLAWINRYDLLFGNNYFFTTSAGLDGRDRGNRAKWYVDDRFRYGWSMPQLYTELVYDDLHVKFGHFYSPIGYEDVSSENNFFITRSYAFQYGEPITQTGLLISNALNDCWSWSSGVVGGWNTFEANTRAAFIGGLTYSVKDAGSVAFTLVTGDDSTTNLPGIGPFANRTMFSIVGTANLTSQLTYVVQHDLGVQQEAATLQGTDQAEWYGLNQYLYYTFNECWSIGTRLEWFRDDDGFNVTGLRPGNPLIGNFFAGNFYEATIGINYRPWDCLTLRPEVRYDWFSSSSAGIGSQSPFDDNTSKNQILYGIDAILHY